MCETVTRSGSKCGKPSRFHVHIRTVPQPLGPNGSYGMETAPAGRSMTSCRVHLARTVEELSALPIRLGSALPTVARI